MLQRNVLKYLYWFIYLVVQPLQALLFSCWICKMFFTSKTDDPKNILDETYLSILGHSVTHMMQLYRFIELKFNYINRRLCITKPRIATANWRWRLVKPKLSNKFCYCPLFNVFIFCHILNTTASVPLGQIEPSSLSTKELHEQAIRW